MGARLLVYDATKPPRGASEFWLRTAWATGARVYKALGRVDAAYGARDWEGALSWLATYGDGHGAIDEVQYWGHGKWGKVYIANDVLSAESLRREHAHAAAMQKLKARVAPNALVWFRTCETFGAEAGQAFAESLTDFLECRAAGHTYVIHALQSGLHGLLPGERAHWDASEGLSKGTAEAPKEARNSTPDAPNTLHFMNGVVPPEWFR